MTVVELSDKNIFNIVNLADAKQEITSIFCCDLLSVAMGKAPADSAWVTVMSNINTLAVAALADVSVVILAQGTIPDDTVRDKAAQQGVNIFCSELPIFEAALKVKELL